MLDFWKFVMTPPFGSFCNTDQVNRPVVNWFVPPVTKNSGGHINLFRFAQGIQKRGFVCRVVVVNDGTISPKPPIEQLRKDVEEWFGHFEGGVYYPSEKLEPAQISFATGWQTAYTVKAFRGSILKYYFIQDYEPSFYPAGSEAVFAENTYKLGLKAFTAGKWLSNKITSEYNMETYPLGFSYDKKLYFKRERRKDGRRRLFYYARPETSRRGWEVACLAMKIIHDRLPDIEFVLAGGQVPEGTFDFPVFAPGSVRLEELGNLYSQCDCALIISFTNLSLLPLEIMACGVPIISNRGPNVEWLLTKDNCMLCDPDPVSIANAVEKFFNLSQEDISTLKTKSINFAESTSWEKEFDKMAFLLKSELNKILVCNKDAIDHSNSTEKIVKFIPAPNYRILKDEEARSEGISNEI